MARIPNPLKLLKRRKTQEPPPPPDDDFDLFDGDGHQLRMGLFEHLKELRDRTLRAFIAVLLGTGIGFIFAGQGLVILQQPFCRLVDTTEACQFQLIAPTDGIVVYLRVALLIGGILAIPMITYQLLMFVIPGLTNKEKRTVIMAIPAITGLFIVGVFFAWFILLPPALGFLDDFLPNIFRPEWTADGYLSFVTALIFWMGVAFETPLIFFVLSLIGLVTAGTLLRNWRIAVVGAAVAAALITPTIDPVNMFLVMAPLMTLYAISIVLVGIGSRINGIGKLQEE